METDFLASGNQFFLPILDTLPTASFTFPSSGNLFLKAFRLVERYFLASGNDFFIYFLDISASDSFFSSSGNVVLK